MSTVVEHIVGRLRPWCAGEMLVAVRFRVGSPLLAFLCDIQHESYDGRPADWYVGFRPVNGNGRFVRPLSAIMSVSLIEAGMLCHVGNIEQWQNEYIGMS